jgi:anti-anti-sigma factor
VKTLDDLIAGGVHHVVLDLGGLPLVNSAALGYLLAAHQKMESEGGGIALTGLRPTVQRILEVTNLDVVFPTFETTDEAVEFVQSDAVGAGGEHAVRRHPWR